MNRAQYLRMLRGGPTFAPALPPQITSPSTVSLAELTAFTLPLTANQAGTWAKTGGADSALFTLTGSTLSMPAKDFEAPTDQNADNTYQVQLTFTSSVTGLTATITFVLTITDVDEIDPVGGSIYAFAPVIKPRELYRTILVPAGDEYIDLQGEVAVPYSPAATSWTLGGADAAKLQAVGAGRYVFAPATRAGLAGTTLSVSVQAANDHGPSQTVSLTIKVPLNANCRFASFETGSDANDGTTPALAWKQAPRSGGFAGTQVTLSGGKVLFFRGNGEHHRYSLNKGASATFVALDHFGASYASPFVYCGTGWGGRAVFDGADVIAGWTPCVSQADALGNPNWANIEKVDLTSQGGAMAFSAMLYCGDVVCWPAQSPVPADPNFFEEALDVTEQGGMWRLPNTGTTAGAAPRIYKAGGVIGVSDARITALFGSTSPVGSRFILWNGNNNTTALTIASYNQATNTITTGSTADVPNSISGSGAYTISHHPKQISAEGQFALSADRLTLYAWRPNFSVTSISRRDRCLALGQRNYVIAEGLQIQHYTGPDTGQAAGGFAIFHGFTATVIGLAIRDIKIRDMRCDGGDGLISASSTGGFTDCIFERIHIAGFNPNASGFRMANKFLGAIGGSPDEVRAYAYAKFRWNYIEADSIGRTAFYAGAMEGAHIHENVIGSLHTMHGNGISFNDGVSAADPTSIQAYVRRNVLEYNLIDGVDRGYTVSISYDGDKLIDRYNTISRNVWLGIRSPVFHPYSGEPGGTVEQNLMMGKTGDTWTGGGAWLDAGNRVVFRRNVVAGIVTTAGDTYNATFVPDDPKNGTFIPAHWTIQDNLDTTNLAWPADADGVDRILSGNARAPGAPFYTWNGTFTDEMKATLGPGQMGPFWTI